MGNKYYQRVKNYLVELNYQITDEHPEQGVLIVAKDEAGLEHLMIGVAEKVLVLELFLFQLPYDDAKIFKRLLQMNRSIVHGGFSIDESGNMVVFRDTLELENLDQNEIEGSLKSLSNALIEFTPELLTFQEEKPGKPKKSKTKSFFYFW